MEEYFLSLKKFKENIQNIDLEKNFYDIFNENTILKNTNLGLEKKINDSQTKIQQLENKIKEKDEELESFKKRSLLTSMSKQIDELKNHISILEKQLKNHKLKQDDKPNLNNSNINNTIKEKIDEIINNDIIEENINSGNSENNKDTQIIEDNINSCNLENNKDNQIPDDINNSEEYEKIEYNSKLYYKIKKKIYRINKDGTLGNLFGKIKNGVITREN